VSDTTFDAFIMLFRRALPKDSTLPDSVKTIQTIIKQFDLGSKKIDKCANDYVLFGKTKPNLADVLSVMPQSIKP